MRELTRKTRNRLLVQTIPRFSGQHKQLAEQVDLQASQLAEQETDGESIS